MIVKQDKVNELEIQGYFKTLSVGLGRELNPGHSAPKSGTQPIELISWHWLRPVKTLPMVFTINDKYLEWLLGGGGGGVTLVSGENVAWKYLFGL